jgi:hypothetical protein
MELPVHNLLPLEVGILSPPVTFKKNNYKQKYLTDTLVPA